MLNEQFVAVIKKPRITKKDSEDQNYKSLSEKMSSLQIYVMRDLREPIINIEDLSFSLI
jgi:hypothetical protein